MRFIKAGINIANIFKINKMKKQFLITTLILIITFSIKGLAQSTAYVRGMKFMGNITISSSERKSKLDTKGSPYYNKDFMFGELELQDGNKLKGLFRYNIYAQELELIVQKDTLIITDPTKIKNIYFSGKDFIYSLILDDRKRNDYVSGAYFEVLNKGKCKVLVKREINLRENRYLAHYGGGGGDGSQRYVPELSYYLRLSDDKPALKIKKSKGSILKILGDHETEIEKYISDNKLKLSENKDLIKVVEYYNTLKEL